MGLLILSGSQGSGGSSSAPGSIGMTPMLQVSPFRTIIQGQIAERSSAKIVAQLQDDDTGEGIPLDSFTSFSLTLYDLASGAIINGRNKQDALNSNGVTIVSAGSPMVTTL